MTAETRGSDAVRLGLAGAMIGTCAAAAVAAGLILPHVPVSRGQTAGDLSRTAAGTVVGEDPTGGFDGNGGSTASARSRLAREREGRGEDEGRTSGRKPQERNVHAAGAGPSRRAGTECAGEEGSGTASGAGEAATGSAGLPGFPAARARVAASRGGEPAAEIPPAGADEEVVTDPGLLALRVLGVDLDRPDEEMRRLAAEYRAGLTALAAGTPVDTARLALLDRGMAGLIRVRPGTAGTVYGLILEETHVAASRYFAHLIRGGDRSDLEGGLTSLATADVDASRRASALIALGPVPAAAALPSVQRALGDADVSVRRAAAGVLAEAARVDPALALQEAFQRPVRAALADEMDPMVRADLRAITGVGR